MYHHDEGCANDASDRRDIAKEIEAELVVERCVDRSCCVAHEKGIAVRCRLHDHLGADIAAGARPVLDDELVAKSLRQPLTHQACGEVSAAPPRGYGTIMRTGRVG